MKWKDWLRIGRMQTAPADACLILVPVLMCYSFTDLSTWLMLGIAILLHFLGFGHNSLMDTALGYDLKDPSKRHHPLVAGRISLHTAHLVIHSLLMTSAIAIGAFTYYYAKEPALSLLFLLIYYTAGVAYNSGLDKETPFSFIPISICFTSLAGWAWTMVQPLNQLGIIYMAYIFLTILFQIAYEGNLKELPVAGKVERVNFLTLLGARLQKRTYRWEDYSWIVDYFHPGYSAVFAWIVKILSILLIGLLITENWSILWFSALSTGIIIQLYTLTAPRPYRRDCELFNMSLMEILSIYLPIPIFVPEVDAVILMVLGVLWFFGFNKLLWEASYPRV